MRYYTFAYINFLLFFSTTIWATTIPDSLQQKLDLAQGKERIQVWEDWYKNLSKEHFLDGIDLLETASKDGSLVFQGDSSILWSCNIKLKMVKLLLRDGYPKEALKIINQSKTALDQVNKKSSYYKLILARWYLEYGYYNFKLSFFDKALTLYLKALKIAEGEKLRKLEGGILLSIANTLQMQKKYQEALLHYQKAELSLIHFTKEEQNKKNPYIKYNKALVLGTLGQLSKAEILMRSALDSAHLTSSFFNTRVQIMLADNLCKQGKSKKALDLFEIIKSSLDLNDGSNNTFLFSEMYLHCLLENNHPESKNWFKKYDALSNSSFQNKIDESSLKWQAKFNASEQALEIEQLEQEKMLADSKLKNTFLFFSLFGLLATFSFIIWVIYARNKKQKESIHLQHERKVAQQRDRLFASISHDIRTPLSLLLAPLERAERMTDNTQIQEGLQLARRQGKHLLRLFNQILDWNKLEAKALELNYQLGGLKHTLKNMALRYEQQAIENGIQFKTALNIPSERQAYIDYDKLDRVLSNLIENAIKFSSKGSRISMEANLSTDTQTSILEVSITDQGPGILKEDIPNLFKRYYQGNAGKEKGGSGIGLALAKEFVQIMKGKIQVDTEYNQGTTFLVSIPILAAKDFVEENQIKPSNDLLPKSKPLILLVEDEIELAKFLSSTLVDSYEVVVAHTAETALSIAYSQIPDLIICDWMLPDHNGGWICQQLGNNELTASIPTLILSASMNDNIKKKALGAGAISWMNKPFQIDTLRQQIQTIISQQQKAHQLWEKKSKGEITDPSEIIPSNPFIKKVIHLIGENLSEETFNVKQLAKELHVSRMQLFRKTKEITGKSPSSLILEYRLQQARKMLKENNQNIAQVAYSTGFTSPDYFGKAYKQYFKVLPSKEPFFRKH